MKPTAEQIKAIALIVDGEAWKAIEDGRDALPGSLWGFRRDIAMEKAMAIAALPFLSTLPIAVEGKVKQLEWDDRTDGDDRNSYANTSIGRYEAFESRLKHPSFGEKTFFGWRGHWTNADQPSGSFEAAKAAAQADYETRILSALISSPSKDGGQEVEAVCCGKPVHVGSPEAYTLECCEKFVRPSQPAAAVVGEALAALRLVAEYDDLLRHWEGPEQVLLAGDVAEIDAAYDKMVSAARAALLANTASEPFPQPGRKDGGEPCGECHLKPGETCDICGARALTTKGTDR